MVVTLSHCQTIATFQRNISQHRWAQHVVCIWAPCCDVLRHVGCCWLKLKMVKFEPTTTKMSQHGGQTRQQCCNMSCLHAAIVWLGLKANPSAIQDDRSANSPFRVFNTLVAYPIFFSSRLIIFFLFFSFLFQFILLFLPFFSTVVYDLFSLQYFDSPCAKHNSEKHTATLPKQSCFLIPATNME